MAGEVSYHCSAEDDAEPVGDTHHSDGGEGLFEGFEAGDFDFGFGIDDDVVHRRVQIDITDCGVGWSRLVLVLGFEVIDEDIEEVVRAFDSMFQPETRYLVNLFLTV